VEWIFCCWAYKNYIKFKKAWYDTDDYFVVNKRFYDEIESKLRADGLAHIFSKKTWYEKGYDDTGEWVEGKLELNLCDVYPLEFIKWVYGQGYQSL